VTAGAGLRFGTIFVATSTILSQHQQIIRPKHHLDMLFPDFHGMF
jgi:hypothetical protein